MATKYATGRSRTIRLRVTVTVEGVWGIPGTSTGSDGGTLGAGSDYTTVSTNKTLWQSYADGFQCLLAVGSRPVDIGDPFGPQNIALGIQVPANSGNGFIPLVLATVGGRVSGTVVMDRVVSLTEYLDHFTNGLRTEVLGSSGTCYEQYTCEGNTFTKFNGSSGFPAGGSLGYGLVGTSTPGYGYNGSATASTTTTSGYNGGDVQLTYSVAYIDEDGNPVFGAPDVPSVGGAAGVVGYGIVKATAATANAGGSAGTHTATLSLATLPRHAYAIQTDCLALPDGSPISQYHRIGVNYTNPFGGIVPTGSFTYTSPGETLTLSCGGTRGTYSLVSTVTGESSITTRTYDNFTPLVTKIAVAADDSGAHFKARIRAPFTAMSLSQAASVTISGGTGLSVPVGVQDLSVGTTIGYRYLRVTAQTASGTGSLQIKSYLNGDTTNHTASKTLTTTSAGVSESVEIDLLEVVGCTTLPDLTLEFLRLTATGATFTIDTIELFRESESLVQSMGNYDVLPPVLVPSATPWLECYTDGVRSKKQAISGSATTGAITLPSLTIRQLVQELNATTRTNYGSWSPGMDASLGSAVTSISPLLGWTATDLASPSGGKSYGTDETYTISAWSDSDAPVCTLHGDGVIGSSVLLTGEATGGLTLQAQRVSRTVEPGILPGSAGFDGTNGAPFGESAGDIHDTTPVRFVGLFRGAAHGMQVGTTRALPINETDIINPDGSTTALGTPIPRGQWVPRASGFALSNQPLKGLKNYNRRNTIDNAGGTAAAPTTAPYSRGRDYVRVWPALPSGTIIGMDTSATNRVVRAYKNGSGVLLLDYWNRSGWDTVDTGLTLSGGGAISYDRAGAEGRLWLAYEDSGAIKSRYTDDEGGTWGTVATIFSAGTYPAVVHSPTSVRHYFCVASGALKTKALDSQGNTVIAESTIVASGVASSPIGATHDGETIHVTYQNGSGAMLTVSSTDGGVTFS